MNKYQNATLDTVAIMALAMGVETLTKDLKAGILMLIVGVVISLLKYHFRKRKK